MIEIILPAFVISTILIGIHSYLGLHILKRSVIFVDLALAQLAACGAIFGILLGFQLHSLGSYITSFSFTLIGAFIFSFSRAKKIKEIPQEAIIGIVYVVSAALSVLLLDRMPKEAEHLKEMLVGNILFVSWPQIIKTALLYSFIGILHYIFREKFIMISFEPQKAEKSLNIRFWDFLFYVLFGMVVTSSVEVAGVFLVFNFLIIPAAMSIIFFSTIKQRVIFSWISGLLIMSAGIFLSVKLDTPTGATIICLFGFSLISSYFIKKFSDFLKFKNIFAKYQKHIGQFYKNSQP
ncbi:MAG: metal ABC transporter permease [Elusimicrobiota bacterium]